MHAHPRTERTDSSRALAAAPDPEHAALTVGALLAEPTLHGRLAGGEAGLDNSVAWCLPLGEVPAAAGHGVQAARERDLSAVVVHLDAAELSSYDRARSLMADMRRRGVAALFAWPGRGHTRVDLRAPARAADELGVPLIEVAREADFRSTGYLVASKVLAQSAHVLEYSVRVHRALGEVFGSGAGLQALTRTMSQLAQTPVLVVGNEAEQLAYGDVSDRDLPVDMLAGPVGRSLGDGNDRRSDSPCRLVAVEIEGETWHAMAAPITVATDVLGVVALLEPDWPTGDHDLAQHAVIAEQGSTLLGSELLRQRSVHAAEERARGDFVDTLLHGRFSDQHELAARAQYFRFDVKGRFAVFVVTPPRPAQRGRPEATRVHGAFSTLGRTLESSLADDGFMLTAAIGSMLVVIRGLPKSLQKGADALAERTARHGFGERLQRAVQAVVRQDVHVTHGRAGTGAAGVAQSYREARTAAALARRSGAPQVCGYDDLRVFAAVQEVAASASGKAFAAEVLEPLRRLDGQTGNLEHIVIAYINESGNLNAAARKLHLHRNTMLYKLDRASRAMQMDVRTAETQFMIWLAHHIDSMSRVQEALDSEMAPP